MFSYSKTHLPNGLTILTSEMSQTKAVAILFLIKVGSRYEPKSTAGISHFLEHTVYKGTTNRPSTLVIAQELDSMGAAYNAFTSEEYTGFYIKCAQDHFLKSLDIITDVLFNPIFDPAEIERERLVIKEELNMYLDTPIAYIGEIAKEQIFGDNPLGRPVIGSRESIAKITRDNIINFRQKFYTPDNMIVVISGAKTKGVDWVKEISRYFLKHHDKKQGNFAKVKVSQSRPKVKIHYKKTDQVHLSLGVPGIRRTDPRRPILRILDVILGANMSSRLFIELRERRGLGYYVHSAIWDFIDTGALTASAGVEIGRTEEAIKVILNEMKGLADKKVPSRELTKAKEFLKGHLYLGLEDSFSVADFIADQWMFWGKVESPEQIVAKFQKVTASEVQAMAKNLFQASQLNLAMIGPFKEEKKFGHLLKF
jgi:predicted Zn-dependent peptidase